MEKKIIKGDCLKELYKIKNESIDLIICDPPYMEGFTKWK
jgi:DNA modification methylase